MDKQVVKLASHDSAWTWPAGYNRQAGAVMLSTKRTLCLTNTSPVKALRGCQAQTVNSWSLGRHEWLHWGTRVVLRLLLACSSWWSGANVRRKECTRGWGTLLSLQGKLGLAFEVSIVQSWVQGPELCCWVSLWPGNVSLCFMGFNFLLFKKKKILTLWSHLVIKDAKFLK